ncbi:MAG: transcriptional regulator, LacI family [Bryobacterales bacterium]|nr:transcriptional regulator, LacI family [Bryobacterales bacterium]
MQPVAVPANKNKRLTLRDIAKIVGVSASTASRALNNNSAISEEIRRKVNKAAKDANYIPNTLARGLALQRSQLIGLLVPSIANPFFAEILRGAHDVAQQKSYVVALCDTQRDKEREELFSERLLQSQVDGIIVTGSVMLEDRLIEWRKRNIPVVFAGRRSAGMRFSGVSVDDVSAGYQATRYLIDKGHKKVLFFGGKQDSAATRDRQRGYLDAVESLGLSPSVSYGDYGMESGFREAAKVAQGKDRPDAVFAANDLMAIGLIMGLANLGVKVPEDIAVMGCDDIAMGALIRPALTSVRIPMYEIGVRAMGLLLHELEVGQTGPAESILLDCGLVIRDSA